MDQSRGLQVAAAMAVVYVVWGSTYLGIRVMVEALPPLLSAGLRFLLAGVLMLAWVGFKRLPLPRRRSDWGWLAATSALMLVGANGMVTWAEQWVESNQAALIVATSALWIAGLGSLGVQGIRVTRIALAGLVVGLIGVGVLVGEGLQLRQAPVSAYAAMLVSPFLWALGAIVSKRKPAQCAPLVAATLQVLMAGTVMTLLGLLNGDAERCSWSTRSLAAMAYLAVFGTCIAYACYYWLVHEVAPSTLGTHAYVNPAVAVLLGAWLLDEQLGPLQLAGTFIILASVVIVNLAPRWTRNRS
ncbi:EamA family transporter [Panacagrimonas sp.]|uniref:EamA family transporter n=1 Tax=Panacagrimonas sp. TaxID=2480088 RepID=UPI003B5200A8